MPTYQLPPPQPRKEEEVEKMPPPDDWARRISLPANKAIVEAVSVGDDVEVTVKGSVISVRATEDREYTDHNVEIIAEVVTVKTASTKEADEAFKEGFRQGQGRGLG